LSVYVSVYLSVVQTGLVDVFSQFSAAVSRWQTFWDVVDEIDGSTCVLEPEKPTRAATYRRLALGRYWDAARSCLFQSDKLL